MVLLDTHIALWLLAGEERLTRSPAFGYLEQASQRGSLRLAAISLYEIADLNRRGLVRFDVPLADVFETLLQTPGLQLSPVDERVALETQELGTEFPGEETDRLICATTRALRGSLITADSRLIRFSESGALRIIPVE